MNLFILQRREAVIGGELFRRTSYVLNILNFGKVGNANSVRSYKGQMSFLLKPLKMFWYI